MGKLQERKLEAYKEAVNDLKSMLLTLSTPGIDELVVTAIAKELKAELMQVFSSLAKIHTTSEQNQVAVYNVCNMVCMFLERNELIINVAKKSTKELS